MENVNQELLEKAKQAKSATELLSLADQNGVKLTEEQAKAFYAQLHPSLGEIGDDELDNVAGGGCGGGGSEEVGVRGGDHVLCPTNCPRCGSNYGVLYMSIKYGCVVHCDNCKNEIIWFGTADMLGQLKKA